MNNRIFILGIAFNCLTEAQAVSSIISAIDHKASMPFTVVTPNPIMVMNTQKNEALFSAISSADLSLADGVGIISAARRMGTPLPERVTGIDTAYSVLEKLAEVGGSVYLLGAKPGVAEKASAELTEKLPSLRVVGTHDGYFESDA